MKIRIPIKSIALTVSLLLGAGLCAQTNYYWNPTGAGLPEGNTTAMGGNGIWGSSGYRWWDTVAGTPVERGASANPFGSNGPAEYNLYFNGNSTITKTDIAHFAGTNTSTYYYLNFDAGSVTNFITAADSSTAGFKALNAGLLFKVGAGGIVNIGGTANGGTGKTIRISSGKNLSNGDGIAFLGAGTYNLGQGVELVTDSGNSRILVNDGATVNFNQGSAVYGANGSASNPFPSYTGSRIVVHNGTLNINGGDLYLGYRADSAGADTRGYGLGIGINTGAADTATQNASDTNATVNIYSGTVTAIGDGRRPNNIGSAGVTFGYGSEYRGGTLNLYGGTLITTNIRAQTDIGKAVLNLDGGTIVVSTETIDGNAQAGPTDANLQTRLNNFIAGFCAPEINNKNVMVIGGNGVTFDTSQIDTAKTNGTATILSPFTGTGDLIVKGRITSDTDKTTLLLNTDTSTYGEHSYTGSTLIESGILALGANGTGIQSSKEIHVKGSAIFDVSRRDTAGYTLGTKQLLHNSGSGKVVGKINMGGGIIAASGNFLIEGDLAGGAGSTFDFNNLGTDFITLTGTLSLDAGVTFDFTGNAASIGTYDLIFADEIQMGSYIISGGASGYKYDLSVLSSGTGEKLQLQVSVIPEPGTYALLISLGSLVFLIRKRCKRS